MPSGTAAFPSYPLMLVRPTRRLTIFLVASRRVVCLRTKTPRDLTGPYHATGGPIRSPSHRHVRQGSEEGRQKFREEGLDGDVFPKFSYHGELRRHDVFFGLTFRLEGYRGDGGRRDGVEQRRLVALIGKVPDIDPSVHPPQKQHRWSSGRKHAAGEIGAGRGALKETLGKALLPEVKGPVGDAENDVREVRGPREG